MIHVTTLKLIFCWQISKTKQFLLHSCIMYIKVPKHVEAFRKVQSVPLRYWNELMIIFLASWILTKLYTICDEENFRVWSIILLQWLLIKYKYPIECAIETTFKVVEFTSPIFMKYVYFNFETLSQKKMFYVLF